MALSGGLTLNRKTLFARFPFQEFVPLLLYDIQINQTRYKRKGAYKQFIYKASNLNHDGRQQATAQQRLRATNLCCKHVTLIELNFVLQKDSISKGQIQCNASISLCFKAKFAKIAWKLGIGKYYWTSRKSVYTKTQYLSHVACFSTVPLQRYSLGGFFRFIFIGENFPKLWESNP